MKMKQVELIDANGNKMVSWVESCYAITGLKFTLKLGNNKRSPFYTCVKVWDLEHDAEDIQEKEMNRRTFGDSIR